MLLFHLLDLSPKVADDGKIIERLDWRVTVIRCRVLGASIHIKSSVFLDM